MSSKQNPPRIEIYQEVERDLIIDNLLVRIHFISVMIRWTGLAPWECEYQEAGSYATTVAGIMESCA